MSQLLIDFEAVRACGKQAQDACLDKAHRSNPAFKEIATQAILAHLDAVGSASGETLTDIAIAHGAIPHDARAFGGIFRGLSDKKLITTVGFCPRLKGHGTAGGRIWARVR